MSKIIRVPRGDIKLSVSESGRITLDSQLAGGTVDVKTGDFLVHGDNTFIETKETSFYDNIVTVNHTGFDEIEPRDQGQAGFRVNINNTDNAFVVFDKNIQYSSPEENFSGVGGFSLKYALDQGSLLGLRTNSISSYDSDINLETPELIRVVDSNETDMDSDNYLDKINTIKKIERGEYVVIQYLDTGDIVPVPSTEFTSRDVVATVGYVDQEVERESEEIVEEKVYKLQRGRTSVSRVATRSSNSGLDGYDAIDFEVENKIVSQIQKDSFEYNGFRVLSDRDDLSVDTTIENSRPGKNLVLKAASISSNSNSSVKVRSILELSGELSQNEIDTITFPGGISSNNIDGVKLYGSKPGSGDTGVYYVNSENTRDELVGRQRALFMSMIF